MEIFEVLLAGGEACGCFVQILAAVFDVSAGVRGYQVGKQIKKRKQAAAQGDELPKKPAIWPLALLVLAAVFFTGLALMALFRPR